MIVTKTLCIYGSDVVGSRSMLVIIIVTGVIVMIILHSYCYYSYKITI